jgi:DNA repair protein RadA/Sms
VVDTFARKPHGGSVAQSVRYKYVCSACIDLRRKYKSRCPECGSNFTFITIEEARRRGLALPMSLDTGPKKAVHYMLSKIDGLDEVASDGPGIVRGAAYLLSGDPGAGKSTLLLQALAQISKKRRVAYAFLEPGGDFVRIVAHRIGIDIGHIREVDAETVDELLERTKGCDLVVLDSLKALADRCGVAIDEIARRLAESGHETGTTWILIAHINKDGDVAGVVATEHWVDATLHLSGDYGHEKLRVLSSAKNRYGEEHVRFLRMTKDKGLVDVPSASSHLLADRVSGQPGSCVGVPFVLGHRADNRQAAAPVLVEVQALVSEVPTNPETGKLLRQPRLTCDGKGLEAARIRRLLDVLRIRLGVRASECDVTVNVCGDLEIGDKALDVPIAMAIASAARDKPLPDKFCAWGELDLNGIVRSVTGTEAREIEARRAGFEPAVKSGMKLRGLIDSLLIDDRVIPIDVARDRKQSKQAHEPRRPAVPPRAAPDARDSDARRPRAVRVPAEPRGVRAKGAGRRVQLPAAARPATRKARARHRK